MDTQLRSQAEDKMKKALEHFENELSGIRSGRANPGLVDSIKANVYGQEMQLKTIATITTPDAKTIQVQPWDVSNMAAIEKAIRESQSLGLNPSSDGHVLRISIPPLSEETRAQMVKLLHQKSEDCQVSFRNARHESLNDAKTAEKNKTITQDQLSKLEKDLNGLIDKYQKEVQVRLQTKETELMQA